jgi:hypothetical protein
MNGVIQIMSLGPWRVHDTRAPGDSGSTLYRVRDDGGGVASTLDRKPAQNTHIIAEDSVAYPQIYPLSCALDCERSP